MRVGFSQIVWYDSVVREKNLLLLKKSFNIKIFEVKESLILF